MSKTNFPEDHLKQVLIELAKKEKFENQMLELEKKTKEVKVELGKINYLLKIYRPDQLKKIKFDFKKQKVHEAKETPRQMAENALLDLEGEKKAEVIFRRMRKEGYKGSLSACHSVLQRAHKNRRSPIRRMEGEVGYYTYDPKENINFRLV